MKYHCDVSLQLQKLMKPDVFILFACRFCRSVSWRVGLQFSGFSTAYALVHFCSWFYPIGVLRVLNFVISYKQAKQQSLCTQVPKIVVITF